MAKFKITAGAEVDLITQSEMKAELKAFGQEWMYEVARGDRYRRFYAKGTIAGSAVSVGGPSRKEIMGPGDNFVWAVKRLAISPLGENDYLSLYLNDANPASLVHPRITSYVSFDACQLVLYPNDSLLLVGSSLSATGTVTVTGQARELPINLAWRLG